MVVLFCIVSDYNHARTNNHPKKNFNNQRMAEASSIPEGCNCVMWVNGEACYGTMTDNSESHAMGSEAVNSVDKVHSHFGMHHCESIIKKEK